MQWNAMRTNMERLGSARMPKRPFSLAVITAGGMICVCTSHPPKSTDVVMRMQLLGMPQGVRQPDQVALHVTDLISISRDK